MSSIIIACNTIADELNLAIKATGATHPVLWIDSKLHTKPEKLREQIQSAISRISNVSTIILAFGYCGNALVGIKSEHARLVFPKVEDCISVLLGSAERRRTLSKETCSYYLTRGWLESENNLAEEYTYCVKKFGLQRALKVMHAMLKSYRHLTLIDTGAYDLERLRPRTEELATTLGLCHKVVEGSQRLFQKLLTGPYDNEFVQMEPGQEITLDSLLESYRQAQASQI
ncbi:MAG TPA: DUF1638 domain-containing protein [Syntrophorhabdales bacterium]|nr:DUF1638 domain-containing protein [Syntrophorhabdales bacterium]